MGEALLRMAVKDDLPAARRLWERLDTFHRGLGLGFPEVKDAGATWIASFERTLGRFSFLWIAEADGEVKAFLLARLKRVPAFLGGVLVGEISDLYVDEALRGQGVASGLVGLALEHLKAQGVHSIEVQVMERNEGALAFWQTRGFQPEIIQVRLPVSQGEEHAEGHA